MLIIGGKVEERMSPTFYRTSISKFEFINENLVRICNG